MAEIDIKIKNLPQIKAAFGRSPMLMTRELNKAIQLSVYSLERDSKINTPVDTGLLRASHITYFRPLQGEIEVVAEYAPFVHEGTKFMKGRPYLRKAVEKNNEKIQDYFTTAVDNVLKAIGRAT